MLLPWPWIGWCWLWLSLMKVRKTCCAKFTVAFTQDGGERVCPFACTHTYSILAGFLFLYHLHGRTMLDVHVHQLLLYAVFGSAAVAFLEVFHRGNMLMEMLRCTLTMLQGSWFWQVKPKNLQIKGFRARCDNFLCICSLASDRFCAVSSSWSWVGPKGS